MMGILPDEKSPAKTHFANTSFREGDNKINDLYHKPNDTWVFNPKGRQRQGQGHISSEIPFNDWLNNDGLEKISNYNIENDFATLQDQITQQKLELFYRFAKGRSIIITDTNVTDIRNHFNANQLNPNFHQIVQQQRTTTIQNLQQLLANNQTLVQSINKYLIQFKEMRTKL